MSNVLQTDIKTSIDSSSLPLFPDKRDRFIATVDIRQGVWEVLDFRQCDMLSLISERNSSLGKVMPASQKMRYELRFINALQECRRNLATIKDHDEDQLKFQKRIETIYQTKKANLPTEIWNGIYTSAEIINHFRSTAEPLRPDQSADEEDYKKLHFTFDRFAYLTSLTDLPDGAIELPKWLNTIEDDYEVLHRSDFGSRILATLPTLTNTLDRVAEAIEIRLKRKPFCFKGHQPQRATVLNNVFQKYYVQQVQPYMAFVEKASKPWFMYNSLIFSKLPSTKPMQAYSYQVFSLENPKGLWNQWENARDRHSKAWQAILGQCNMMPGM